MGVGGGGGKWSCPWNSHQNSQGVVGVGSGVVGGQAIGVRGMVVARVGSDGVSGRGWWCTQKLCHRVLGVSGRGGVVRGWCGGGGGPGVKGWWG